MLRTRMPLFVVTLVNLPLRTRWKTDSNESALCRMLSISGTSSQTMLGALFAAYCLRNLENSDSVAREGWTDMMESDER